MKDYTEYEAVNFAQDEDFLKWVKFPDEENTRFWMHWIAEHPHKRDEIEEARRMIMAVLQEERHHLSLRQRRSLWDRIDMTIDREQPVSIPSISVSWYYKIAAVAALFAFVLTAIWYERREKVAPVQASAPEFVDLTNTDQAPRKVMLADGSAVILQPGSAIRHPEVFGHDRREVILEGEGFFEIARDTRRPFFVYANEVVTRVLGTSFNIRAFKDEPHVTVEVKTGKVSVFRFEDVASAGDSNTPQQDGLVLTPNQQAVYTRKGSRLTKSLVDDPAVLPAAKTVSFEFADTPMKEVFDIMEEAYGIEIIFDEEIMGGCYLNAALTDESLQDKLSLICKAVNATYEVMDTHIIVYGNGCDD